jgi:hypothetical protein
MLFVMKLLSEGKLQGYRGKQVKETPYSFVITKNMNIHSGLQLLCCIFMVQ